MNIWKYCKKLRKVGQWLFSIISETTVGTATLGKCDTLYIIQLFKCKHVYLNSLHCFSLWGEPTLKKSFTGHFYINNEVMESGKREYGRNFAFCTEPLRWFFNFSHRCFLQSLSLCCVSLCIIHAYRLGW